MRRNGREGGREDDESGGEVQGRIQRGRSLPRRAVIGFPLTNVFWQDVNLQQISQREAYRDDWKALKSVSGRGSSYETPQSVGEGETPSPFPIPSTLSALGTFGVSDLDAFGVSSPFPTPIITQGRPLYSSLIMKQDSSWTRWERNSCTFLLKWGRILAIHFPFLTEAYKQFSMRFGHSVLMKIIKFVATRCQILKAKMHQNRFSAGAPPRPRWKSL